MTATSPITTLAELARDRFTSSKQHDYDSRIEPRSMIADYTLNGRHPYGDEGNNSNGTSNNYASEGHYNREETQSQGQGDSYHPSSAPPTHYPHSGAYLPPPIQTLPFGGVHPHSFASPTSPSLSTTPISPVGHFQHPSSDHYEYDQSQGNYHAPSYHAYHASYPEHHHPLSPTEEGHHFYGSHPIPTGKDDGHSNNNNTNNTSNGSYSSTSSSGHYSRHPFDPNNHHGSNDDHPESPNTGLSMGHDTMVHSEGHGRNDSVSYPASPLSPQGVMSKTKRRSEVFAAHESPYFFPATQHYNLFSPNQSMRYDLQVSAKIDRGFFLAANDWTCYRRNYFQISASFSIAGLDPSVQSEVPCLLERDDELLQIHRFLVCIGAHIQHGEKVIELVQHTPKRDKGPQITPRPTPIRAGGDVNSNASSNSNVITFERVQFKTATANNGKRRAAQQYYQVHVDLYAELDGGERIVVATAFSAPLVVRGRSPGHYADNEEAMSPQDYEGRNHPRNDSIASNGSIGSPPPSMYRYPNSYNSSYQYQSLGTASHMASQYHENGYYGHHDQEYPGSPLSPMGPPHLGGMETPQGHYDSHYTPGSQGFSPESVSPDMYSPSGFPGSGPESPMSNLHQLAYMHDHSQSQHPYDTYGSHQDGYREHDHGHHHDEQDLDHETQMAGLRIHSPVSPVSSAAPTPRRQSFSSSLSKKGDRSSVGSMTRKTRSSSMSGISKRAPSKNRSTTRVSASSAKDFGKGLGISNDHIAESPMEELQS